MLIEPLRTHIRHSISFSLRPGEVHSSGWNLVYNYNQSSIPEKNYLCTTRDNRMRNLHTFNRLSWVLRVLCNRPSWFFRCHPQCPLMPHWPPWCPYPHPHPQYRSLVVKSSTTAGQHDMSSACVSGWCFVRCTPSITPYAPLIPPGRGIWWPRVVKTWGPIDLSSCSILCSVQ